MDSKTITTSGSSVTQWNDKSGNNYHASGGVSPTITTNGVVFNGTTQYLTTALPATPDATNGETWFVIYTGTKASSTGDFLGPAGGNGRRLTAEITATVAQFGLSVSNRTFANAGGALIGNRMIGTATINTGATAAGSALAGTGYNEIVNTSAPFINWAGAGTSLIGVGALGSTRTYWFGGTIHEIIGYSYNARTNTLGDTTMTYDKMRAVQNYLVHKWGILPLITATNDGAKVFNVKGTMTIQ
jgi:hypothetical protein